MPSVRLFVGNLPYQATEDDLRTHFAQVGEPTQIVRPLDRETGRARGFAFVEMATDQDAQTAVSTLNEREFGGRRLTVNEAKPQVPRSGGGGYGGGGGGGSRRSEPRW